MRARSWKTGELFEFDSFKAYGFLYHAEYLGYSYVYFRNPVREGTLGRLTGVLWTPCSIPREAILITGSRPKVGRPRKVCPVPDEYKEAHKGLVKAKLAFCKVCSLLVL